MNNGQQTIASDHVRQSPAMENPSPDGDIEIVPAFTDAVREAADLEKFMHEVLTIEVAESVDPNAAPSAEVGVNGRRIFIPRGIQTNYGFDDQGRKTPIYRKFVERLARAKRISITQNLDPKLGEGINKLQRHRALDYPFLVVHDPNPRGAEWIRSILAEA